MADLVGQVVGQYQIIEQLGRGGMADVYKAFHPGLAVYRALKVIRREFVTEAGFQERFQREAQAVASLRHPNIVQMHDFGVQDDLYYMVMEFVEGQDLKTYLSNQGQIRPFSRIVPTIEQIALALGYAHKRGVIHRDIKPANIMLTAEGQVILTDFGIAKMVTQTESMTQTGVGIGTPSYMSPEQARGLPDIGPGADIYSLGIVLYEMLVGRVPFSADTPLAVMLKVVSDPLPPPREFSPDIPDVLQGVVLKATAKDPAQRYQTTEALIDGLKRSLDLAPDGARPVETGASQAQATRISGAAATTSGRVAPVGAKETKKRSPWLLIGSVLVTGLCLFFMAAGGLWYYFTCCPASSLATWQFVVDASESMNETIDGRSKMEIARAGVTEELKILPPNVNAGLRIFGGGSAGVEPCQDTRLLVEPAMQQGEQLVSNLSKVSPAGEAPLTQAIVQAIGDFDLTRDTRNTLIVITAGLDTCEADAVAQLEALSRRLGIEFDLQLIGLGVNESDKAQLQQIAQAAGGKYHDARNEQDFRQVFNQPDVEVAVTPAATPESPSSTGQGDLQFGQFVNGQIDNPEQVTQYTFTGEAGHSLYFQFDSATEGAYFSLLGPDGRTELFNVYNADSGPIGLDETGSYSLFVKPYNVTPLKYSFALWDVNPPVIDGGPIAMDQYTDGQINIPGQTAEYTFAGEVGHSLYFQFDTASEGAYYTLLGPDGRTELFSVYDADSGPLALEQAGTYTLKVTPYKAGKPKYSFALWDVNPPVIDGGPIAMGQYIDGQINIPGQVAQHTFEGEAGQSLYFQFDSASEGAYYTLLGPDGRTELFSVYNTDSGPIALEQAGTYTLKVTPYSAAKPKYTFTLWDVNPPVIDGGSITLDQFVEGQIKIPGQLAEYGFEGEAGQNIYFQFDSASDGAYYTLLAPDGRTELFSVYNTNSEPVTLEQTGTYTLKVTPYGAAKPAYAFVLKSE